MIYRTATLLTLTAVSAAACPDGVNYRPSDEPGIIGYITYDNPVAACDHDETIIDFGVASVLLSVTANNSCNNNLCPDSVTVLSVEPGVIADPDHMIVDEWGAGTITLRKWEGM